MKFLKIAFIALLFQTVFIACKKETATTPSAPVEGMYLGKYGFGNETPDKNYTLQLKSNGIIQELGQSSGNPTGEGSWQLKGNNFTASYKMLFSPFSDYYIVAVLNPSTGTLSGTWGYKPGGIDGGLFNLKKH
jgi:hypothetical protein